MTLENAKKKAIYYSGKELPFSELKYSKLIFEKDGSAYNQYQYANSLRLCGFTKKSEELFLSISPTNIPKKYRHLLYLFLGFLYKETGDFAKALTNYLKAHKLNSEDTVSYVFIASILKIQDKDREAVKYLTKALKKVGDIDEVNYNLATSYIRLGLLSKALNAINNCLKIDPRYPNAKK